MKQVPISAPFVLRYIYAMVAVIVIALGVVIGSLYTGYQEESRTRNNVHYFHLESVAECKELAREARTLFMLVRDTAGVEVADRSGAAGISSVQIGYGGVLHSMQSRINKLAALQDPHQDLILDSSLKRLVDRFSEVEGSVQEANLAPQTLASIEVLSSTIEQYDRLHKIAADTQLRELADRQSNGPRFLAILAACLGIGTLAVGFLIKSLRTSLARQKSTELALAETQERLHHIQKLDALGRLVGGVAHDFNNLLTAILGHTGLLQDKAVGDEQFESGLREIKQAGLRAAALTQELLAFSRRHQLNPHVLDLNELIQNMEPMLKRIIGSDIRLTFAYANRPFAVELDPDRVQQVIMNLIGNARDAMPDGGKLSLTTENTTIDKDAVELTGVPHGDYARLIVSDSGTGMNDYTYERLFEPFFTTKEKGQGTGLGLSTVHGIVTDSGGHIVVETEQGAGSKFSVYFPRAEHHPERTVDEASPTPNPRGSETILIVDDDAQIRRFVEAGLSSLGYRVLTASGGAGGLELCRKEDGAINVILSDIVMSSMSGPQFMASALKIKPDAMPIYMSTYTEDTVLQLRRSKRSPDIPFITKPFELELLSRRIRQCLDHSDGAITNR